MPQPSSPSLRLETQPQIYFYFFEPQTLRNVLLKQRAPYWDRTPLLRVREKQLQDRLFFFSPLLVPQMSSWGYYFLS